MGLLKRTDRADSTSRCLRNHGSPLAFITFLKYIWLNLENCKRQLLGRQRGEFSARNRDRMTQICQKRLRAYLRVWPKPNTLYTWWWIPPPREGSLQRRFKDTDVVKPGQGSSTRPPHGHKWGSSFPMPDDETPTADFARQEHLKAYNRESKFAHDVMLWKNARLNFKIKTSEAFFERYWLYAIKSDTW